MPTKHFTPTLLNDASLAMKHAIEIAERCIREIEQETAEDGRAIIGRMWCNIDATIDDTPSVFVTINYHCVQEGCERGDTTYLYLQYGHYGSGTRIRVHVSLREELESTPPAVIAARANRA